MADLATPRESAWMDGRSRVVVVFRVHGGMCGGMYMYMLVVLWLRWWQRDDSSDNPFVVTLNPLCMGDKNKENETQGTQGRHGESREIEKERRREDEMRSSVAITASSEAQ